MPEIRESCGCGAELVYEAGTIAYGELGNILNKFRQAHTLCRPPKEPDYTVARVETAEARIDRARRALIGTGYFTPSQVGDDIAPRITELWSAMAPTLSDDELPLTPSASNP